MAHRGSQLAADLGSLHPGSIVHGIECRDVPGAGRGIFTTQTIPPSTKLLEIPSTALLNPRTLFKHHALPAFLFPPEIQRNQPPRKRVKISSSNEQDINVLSSKQLMGLYLSLHRPRSSKSDDGPPKGQSQWDEYIQTLPSNFRPWHPLTWLSPTSHASQWKSLINSLPTGAWQKLQQVIVPWERDRDVLLKVIQDDTVWDGFGDESMEKWIHDWRGRGSDDIVEDLLWGWLNVNTRSLYIPLLLPSAPCPTPSIEQNNHSLAPLLDFVNHSSSSNQPCLLQFAPPKNGPSTSYTSSFRLVSPKDRTLEKGEEVTFSYGARGDEVLFAEYGFVPSSSGAGLSKNQNVNDDQHQLENYWAEIDVSWYIQEVLWNDLPEDEGRVKRLLLEKYKYWGDYTFHASPTPAHPSHRLLPALRLLHLPLSTTDIAVILSSSDLKSPSPPLQRFLHTLSGAVEIVDPTNESAVRKSLMEMCVAICSRADQGIANISRLMETGRDVDGFEEAVEMVCKLWIVEKIMAGMVKKSIESEEAF